MITADSYVRARIDSHTKMLASNALASMGLTVSDAIRLLMIRIADENRLPFAVTVPNSQTQQAIQELESGQGEAFQSLEALMDDLHEKH